MRVRVRVGVRVRARKRVRVRVKVRKRVGGWVRVRVCGQGQGQGQDLIGAYMRVKEAARIHSCASALQSTIAEVCTASGMSTWSWGGGEG